MYCLGLIFFLSMSIISIQNLSDTKTVAQKFLGSSSYSSRNKEEEEEDDFSKFKKITKIITIKSYLDNEKIGSIYVFDNNQGYIAVSNDKELIWKNTVSGIPVKNINKVDSFLYDGANFFFVNGKFAFSKIGLNMFGKDTISDKFNSHCDSVFTSAKTRYMLSDWDSEYDTMTNKSDALFKDKITWSTYQYGGSMNCGPLAIANLLWTYKVNNVVDLTGGATNSTELADIIYPLVGCSAKDGTSQDNMSGVNDFLPDGYHLDYIDVANGVADNLEISPVIGLYNYTEDWKTTGHFVLITGKGRSVYKTFLGIKFWTSWDVTNSYYSYDNVWAYNGFSYKRSKYWVDNQYITCGYCLRNSDDEQVSLGDNYE